ncbi:MULTISPECIES: hypothetical protein [Dehalococcoides]|uniref:Terminase large subunit gp17-like C-terminal domain-containing protein n=1 Tax=Dehalococcoides mccartyi TaxID=61435 RepID=A0AB38ZBM3_9CHLR|nr:hypothetical protein [Dehalococcoides mccartyi]WRO07970.1 hypothetical protein VLL09_03525 [Dehalococcoides mccartyi]
MINKLRPYQQDIAKAVLQSIFNRQGQTFSVEIARQGGKNELSSQLELLLLTLFMFEPKNLVKCAPTFKPQLNISMMRLKDRLNEAGFGDIYQTEGGYIIRLNQARAVFLSAEPSANVVGNTAHLLLEVDEAQDVNREKYSKEFKPMGATTNVTTVLYGTTWDNSSLLEEIKRQNIEKEHQDGLKRHFRYDWEEVAAHNPAYLAYALSEKDRLGENHPLFLTQYRLLPVSGGGGMFSNAQLGLLKGSHPCQLYPENGKVYVAGLDLAGEDVQSAADLPTAVNLRRDSSVLTIAELDYTFAKAPFNLPQVRLVCHYSWQGARHALLYEKLVELLGKVWKCRKVAVDATGLGQPVASFLRESLGSRILSFVFQPSSKSRLGFNLLSAVNSGRLKMYAANGSAEYALFWQEMELARADYRQSQQMNFYVETTRGHDDYLMSLALCLEAAEAYHPRSAKGSS